MVVEQTEEAFLAEYDPTRFPLVAVTVDVAALTIHQGKLCVLAIERTNHPFKGKWALPGAFPKPNEHIYVAAIRGLVSKTNVAPPHIEQLGSYGGVDRDPRMRVYSIAYLAVGTFDDKPQPGYHAAKAEWIPATEGFDWAFDHEQIVSDAVWRARSKMEYTPLATRFLPPTFTMPDLMEVYRIVWDQPIDRGNFYRKVKATQGFVEPTDDKFVKVLRYRAGDAKMLYPPIRRDTEAWS